MSNNSLLNHQSVKLCLEFVKQKHSKQFDKGTNHPYYWHLARCAVRLDQRKTLDSIITALCHDLLEDTDCTLEELAAQPWMSATALEAVKMCSNIYHKDKTHKDWYALISTQSLACSVKCVDCADNASIERLRGLEKYLRQEKNIAKEKKLALNLPPPLMSSKVLLQSKKTITTLSYGLYQRFIKDLQILCSEQSPQGLCIGEFNTLENLKNLHDLIGPQEFDVYLKAQKLQGVEISVSAKVIQDKAGNDYMALEIDDSLGNALAHSLDTILPKEKRHTVTQNQKNRDSNKYHCTVLSAQEYSKTLKNPDNFKIINDLLTTPVSLCIFGTGTLKDKVKNSQCYYSVCSSGWIDSFREKLSLPSKHLHITLGFEPRDVHYGAKDMKTIVAPLNVFDLVKSYNSTLTIIGQDSKYISPKF